MFTETARLRALAAARSGQTGQTNAQQRQGGGFGNGAVRERDAQRGLEIRGTEVLEVDEDVVRVEGDSVLRQPDACRHDIHANDCVDRGEHVEEAKAVERPSRSISFSSASISSMDGSEPFISSGRLWVS